MESYLAEKAETMLAKVLGYGRCEVRVSADIDFEDSLETTRKFDRENAVPVSEWHDLRTGSADRATRRDVRRMSRDVAMLIGERELAAASAGG